MKAYGLVNPIINTWPDHELLIFPICNYVPVSDLPVKSKFWINSVEEKIVSPYLFGLDGSLLGGSFKIKTKKINMNQIRANFINYLKKS